MNPHDVMIARAALQKMFRSSFFSICEVRAACTVLRVPDSGPDFERLRALHCMKWGEMTPELRHHVVELVKRVVGQEPFDPIEDARPQATVIDVSALAAPATHRGLIGKARRLLGFA